MKMKSIAVALSGFSITLILLALMTSLIAEPQKLIVKKKKIVVSPSVLPKEEPQRPDKDTPKPPKPSIVPSLDINTDIQVEPLELKDLVATNFSPANTNVIDGLALPGEGFYEMSELDSQAIPLIQTSPSYPIIALQKGIEGWVKLKFDVDAVGMAQNIKVLKTSHKKVFDREAIKALKKWRFKPGKQNGESIGLDNQTVTMEFNLEQN